MASCLTQSLVELELNDKAHEVPGVEGSTAWGGVAGDLCHRAPVPFTFLCSQTIRVRTPSGLQGQQDSLVPCLPQERLPLHLRRAVLRRSGDHSWVRRVRVEPFKVLAGCFQSSEVWVRYRQRPGVGSRVTCTCTWQGGLGKEDSANDLLYPKQQGFPGRNLPVKATANSLHLVQNVPN